MPQEEFNNQEEQNINDSQSNNDTISNEENQVISETSEPTLEDKNAELNDKFLRLYSEFDNYRKRTNKEKIELIETAASGILKDLIPVLDDFERAISNNVNVEDPTALKEGFTLIYNKFKSLLESKGLKEMEAKGEIFDSEIHEAIANVPAPSEEMKGKVIDDVEKGYYLKDKVIRYAKVVVGQ